MNRGKPPAPLVRPKAAAARLTPGRGDFSFRDFSHRTARVHHGPRWCGGGVAACRARAAGAGIRVRDATTISIWLNFFRTLRLG
jgi:hypothetical protein